VDTWLTFFCALTVYLTVLVAQGRGGLGLAFLCGVCQGLTILTRPAFLVSLPGPILSWGVSEATRRGRRALLCGVVLPGRAATVPPLAHRHYPGFRPPRPVPRGRPPCRGAR